MNAVTRFVAVVFGPHRREGGSLAAPGDADCRWRVFASSERRDAVEFEVASSDARSVEPAVDVRRESTTNVDGTTVSDLRWGA